jgi:uncharacterized protein
MKLREKISSDYITAFKEKNTSVKNLLSVIKGEIQTTEKNLGQELSDEQVIKILNKSQKSLKEMVSGGDKESELELLIIQSYLPKQMSRLEIEDKVSELMNSGIDQIGSIMREFSNLPADKKIVSEVIKELVK